MAVLKDADRETISTEIQHQESSMRPPRDLRKLNLALGSVLTLTAGNMSAEQMQNWLQVAVTTLSTEPAEALLEAIEEAKRTVRFSNEIVPFISKYCEDFKKPIIRHLSILNRIVE